MKRVFSLMLIVVLVLSFSAASASGGAFPDVTESYWAYNEISAMYDRGLVTGLPDGSFAPMKTLSVAEYYTMLARMINESSPVEAQQPLAPDSSGGYWAFPYHDFLDEVIMGNDPRAYSEVHFTTDMFPRTAERGNAGISRYEMAALTAQTLVYYHNYYWRTTVDIYQADAQITDFNSIPEQYRDPVRWVYTLGIIKGFPDGSFGGDSTLTRAEACAVILRADAVYRNPKGILEIDPTKPVKDPNADPNATPVINADGSLTAGGMMLPLGAVWNDVYTTVRAAGWKVNATRCTDGSFLAWMQYQGAYVAQLRTDTEQKVIGYELFDGSAASLPRSITINGKLLSTAMTRAEVVALMGEAEVSYQAEYDIGTKTVDLYGTSDYDHFFSVEYFPDGTIDNIFAVGDSFSFENPYTGEAIVAHQEMPSSSELFGNQYDVALNYVEFPSYGANVKLNVDRLGDNGVWSVELSNASTTLWQGSLSRQGKAVQSTKYNESYALAFYHRVNAFRAYNNVSPLQWHDSLAAAALERAEDLSSMHTLGHLTSSGESFSTVVEAHGLSGSGAGENCASFRDMDIWFVSSDGHRENLLISYYSYIGIATDGGTSVMLLHTGK